MRTGANNSQTDSVFGFSKVMSMLSFRRRQQKAGRRRVRETGNARWAQTYWGRKFMKSV
jgi:hypothetical protein